MKKAGLFFAGLFLVTLSSVFAQESSDIPEWFLNPPRTEDFIFGAGTAKMSDLNMSMQTAEARARGDFNLTLYTIVQGVIADYAGIAESRSFAEAVEYSLSKSRLQRSARVYKRELGEDGTVYCLVSLKKAKVVKIVADIMESKASKYAEFEVMNVLEALETQLAEIRYKPPVTDPAVKEENPGSQIPEWFLNPPITEDLIFGAGTAKMSDLNMSMQMAESRARQDIYFTLYTIIKGVIADYAGDAGIAEIQITANSLYLTGLTVYKRELGKDGTVYCLISLKKADAVRIVADKIDSEVSQYEDYKDMDVLPLVEAQLAEINKPVTE